MQAGWEAGRGKRARPRQTGGGRPGRRRASLVGGLARWHGEADKIGRQCKAGRRAGLGSHAGKLAG
jgi:hypothetical protein